MTDVFSNLQSAAHAGAFGMGSHAQPTPAQIKAGNYAKGSFRLHGLRITIETPMFQSRRGKEDGEPWSITCMAHYGYVNGTKGADGDAVDVFVGPAPESLRVYVVNQNAKDGSFDEHKVLLGFIDQEQACTAYMNSYEKGWTGLGSVAACTIKQFKYWLKHGDLSQPLSPDLPNIPQDEALSMTDVFARWGADNLPVGQTVGALLYEMRRTDPDGLMFDSATMADITESLADDGEMLDAMVIEYKQFDRKAAQLLRVMQNVGGEVKADAVEVSKPFKSKGTTQVAMLFTMSDGQSVSVFFHNPDSTPNKLMPADELISWKWVQNKKDITVVVAPEGGQDINPRIVCRRIMALIQKNSAKFVKANENKTASTAALDELKASVESKTGELAALDTQISELQAQLAEKKAAPVAPVAAEPAPGPRVGTFFSKASYQAFASGREKLGMVNGWGLFYDPIDTGAGRYMLTTTYNNVGSFQTEEEARAWAKANKANAKGHFSAEPASEPVAIPETVLGQIRFAVQTLQEADKSLANVVAVRGHGANLALALAEQQPAIDQALAKLAKVREVGATNGADVEAAIAEAGGVPDFSGYQAAPPASQSTASIILEDYADVAALGSATVLSVGAENVYFDKDGKQYMTKLLNTDDYEPRVGEVVDLSGVVDPYVAPTAAEIADQEKIQRLLGMLTSSRERLAGMAPADAFYGNLVRDIADMARQLWDAGYRGPEASAQSVSEVPPEESAPKSVFLGATLVWSEGSHDENKEFTTLADLDSWFKATFSPAQMDNQSGSYYKNKLVIRSMDEAGTKREDTTRVDVSRSQGDFDPAKQTIAQYLSESGFGGFTAGMTEVVEPAPAAAPESDRYEEINAALTAEGFTRVQPNDWASPAYPLEDGGTKGFNVRAGGEPVSMRLSFRITFPGITGGGQEVGTYQDIPSLMAAFAAEKAKVAPAPVAEPAEDEDTGTIEAEGRDNNVKTAKGTKVVTGFKVIEAKNLIISHETDGTVNPEYPPEIQPRDRARTTSQAWVQKTARNLDPDSLGRTQRADSGAPIVGTDRVVESGNGRAMAVREAYRIGQADEYREWLLENAEYFGIDPAKIQRMKAPVLVRVRKTEVNRVEFAVESNQDDKLAMTATEKARSDAKRLDTAMLSKLADGDLNSAANRDFVAAFLQSLGDAEAAQYLTTDGKPTSGLISRLQAALFAGAYSDDRLLEMTADQAKPEIANIVSALNSAAPDFMRAKEQDRIGAEQAGEQVTDSLELSLNQEAVNAIIGATNVLRQAKEAGMGLDEFLRQGDMFGGTDPAVAAMAVFISANNRSAKRMSTAFKAMAQFVESENVRKQTAGLFGDEPASFTDIVSAANRKLEQEYGEGLFAIDQGDMFNQAPPAAPVVEPEAPNEDDALQNAKTYLDDIIGGATDLGSPGDVLKELERIYAAYGEDKLSELFIEASDAFRDYALKATAGAF
jgi:hypothetical protein